MAEGYVLRALEAKQQATREDKAILTAAICRNAIVRLPRIKVAYFQPGSDRELFNQGNAALFCAAMDALLCFRYDFIGPIAELRCKRPMCIQDLGLGVAG